MYRILLIFAPIILYAQNVDMYISLIHEGQVEGVKEQLPELISKYPNDPGVLYLQALLTTDGMKSLELYSSLLDKFPESKYSADAALKIGEYFYARGLYSQAGQQLCNIPRVYPRFQDIQRVLDLMVSSFLAIGEEDSVTYYVGIYQSMFPNLDVKNYPMKNNKTSSNYVISKQKRVEPRPYLIQIGAFSSIENAKRLKLQVSQIGYQVEIAQVETNGRSLNAVRVVRYKNKSEAERVGKVLKKKLGTDYRVLYRPKSQKM
tara:strand:+ start:63 stop:845 length:783 start_codon:yes stop_codon:yes gene_type:complete